MSKKINLVDFSLIKTKVEKYKRDYGLEKLSEAFMYVILETFLNLSIEEIENSITDSGADRGIDAMYIDDESSPPIVHLFNCKYTSNFEKAKNNNFPGREIDKIINIIDRIFDKDKNLKKHVNPLLWDKIKDIWRILDKDIPKFKLYLVGNMLPPKESERKRLEETLTKYRAFEITYITHKDIIEKIIEKKRKIIDGQIQVLDNNYFERTDGEIKGLTGTVATKDFLNLIINHDDSNMLNEDVFDENIRVYLGSRNKINKQIIKTALSDKNYLFWYLNNGITITCDEFSYQPARSPVLHIKNLQIVNGGQTTHALFEAFKEEPEKTKNILLLVRIYETKDKSISSKITETTNSQTPVRSRDLRATDFIQRQLEEQFLDLGYYYERKKNQYANRQVAKRIDNERAAQSYMSFHLDMPSNAKSKKAEIFGDKYEIVFSDEISALELLLPFQLFEYIEEKKNHLKKKLINLSPAHTEEKTFIMHASYHILFTVKLLAQGSGISIKVPSMNELKETSKKLKKLYSKSIKIVGKLVKDGRKKDPDYSHNRFFKDPKTIEKIKNEIRTMKKL